MRPLVAIAHGLGRQAGGGVGQRILCIGVGRADSEGQRVVLIDGFGPDGREHDAPEERRAAIRDALHDVLGRPRAGFSLPARVVAVTGRRT